MLLTALPRWVAIYIIQLRLEPHHLLPLMRTACVVVEMTPIAAQSQTGIDLIYRAAYALPFLQEFLDFVLLF